MLNTKFKLFKSQVNNIKNNISYFQLNFQIMNKIQLYNFSFQYNRKLRKGK